MNSPPRKRAWASHWNVCAGLRWSNPCRRCSGSFGVEPREPPLDHAQGNAQTQRRPVGIGHEQLPHEAHLVQAALQEEAADGCLETSERTSIGRFRGRFYVFHIKYLGGTSRDFWPVPWTDVPVFFGNEDISPTNDHVRFYKSLIDDIIHLFVSSTDDYKVTGHGNYRAPLPANRHHSRAAA